MSRQVAQGFCTFFPVPSPGLPDPGGRGQGGASPNTFHTIAALGENFIPWDVLASYLLGVS